jgi:hypothetical protein
MTTSITVKNGVVPVDFSITTSIALGDHTYKSLLTITTSEDTKQDAIKKQIEAIQEIERQLITIKDRLKNGT